MLYHRPLDEPFRLSYIPIKLSRDVYEPLVEPLRIESTGFYAVVFLTVSPVLLENTSAVLSLKFGSERIHPHATHFTRAAVSASSGSYIRYPPHSWVWAACHQFSRFPQFTRRITNNAYSNTVIHEHQKIQLLKAEEIAAMLS